MKHIPIEDGSRENSQAKVDKKNDVNSDQTAVFSILIPFGVKKNVELEHVSPDPVLRDDVQ